MTKATLTRSAKVYDLQTLLSGVSEIPGSHDAAVFGAEGSEPFTLTVATWRRMGEPRQITVTIEPGDTLTEAINEENQ